MFKNALTATGLAGLVIAAQPAWAGTEPAPRQASAAPISDVIVQHRTVRYVDLDLSTAQGRAVFDNRLRRAAAAVCDAGQGSRPLGEAMEVRRCSRGAVQTALRLMADRGAQPGTVKVAAR